MKHIFAASIFTAVSAQRTIIDPRKFSTLTQLVVNQLNLKDPSGTWTTNDVSDRLTDYGCYCFAESRELLGNRGKPVDEQDKLCLDLYRCHNCASKFDFPGDCMFTSNYGIFLDQGEFKCSTTKNTDCERSRCECDKRFASRISELWTQNSGSWSFDTFYWKQKKNVKKNPTFDAQAVCKPNGPTGITANNECCGEIGERIPFDNNMMECCADKRVTFIGQC